eukprot:1146960-Prymnesium_polylepis.1
MLEGWKAGRLQLNMEGSCSIWKAPTRYGGLILNIEGSTKWGRLSLNMVDFYSIWKASTQYATYPLRATPIVQYLLLSMMCFFTLRIANRLLCTASCSLSPCLRAAPSSLPLRTHA